MLGRVLVNMIIIPAVILTLSNGIVNKSFGIHYKKAGQVHNHCHKQNSK